MDDEGAFREFVAARLGAMSRVAYLLAGDHHGAEDLVQSSLVQLARHWRRVSSADHPDAYVRRVIYNEHVSAWRRDHGAEDLVQSSLVQLARHWRRVSSADHPDAYVRRVIYNEHVSAWRRHRGA